MGLRRGIFAVMRFAAHLQILLSAALLGTVCSEELNTALAVRSLSAKDAEVGVAVDLIGTVIFADPPATVFIQDDTAGTFFRLGRENAPEPGLQLRVQGTTYSGLYLTGIENAKFEVLGTTGLPEAQEATFEDLRSGRFHYQRVKIAGIVRTVSLDDEGTSSLRLAMGGSIVEVRIDELPGPGVDWIDSEVAISGLAVGHINDRRQLVRPYLRCHDWSEVEVVHRPNETPLVSAEEVLNFDVRGQEGHRVRFQGRVLANFPGGDVFLRGEASSILVRFALRPQSLRPGQWVEVAGFPAMSEFSAFLGDAEILGRENQIEEPLPVETSIQQLSNGDLDGDLVSLTATLIDWYRTKDGVELVLQDVQSSIRAVVPGIDGEGFVNGARLRVQGICNVVSARGSQYSTRPEAILIRCRDGGDVRVIGAPSWWTPRRLAVLLLMVCGVTMASALWITLLRRRVQEQTSALREKIESEAALEERQRIAREFHDTLEQDLAGLSLRLDAAVAKGDGTKIESFLTGAKSLVSRIQSETRNLVSDLRSDGANGDGLESALQELVNEQETELGPSVTLELGELGKIPSRFVHHLKMIAREAVTNVVKHAEATTIQISAAKDESGKDLTLSIRDDGKGMDAESETNGKSGHFGCMGIRERCRKIGAEVMWQSEGGGGTEVVVRLPLQTEKAEGE
ncbi:MAG: sensor histidine kinase [Verrucomicrobiota bacterium]